MAVKEIPKSYLPKRKRTGKLRNIPTLKKEKNRHFDEQRKLKDTSLLKRKFKFFTFST